ncbi:hypothetical protein ONZ45_g12427 [Pleurotus djamor]|nr:hypothetical protein ONZ45_g12427 [Pleurotus djamor]
MCTLTKRRGVVPSLPISNTNAELPSLEHIIITTSAYDNNAPRRRDPPLYSTTSLSTTNIIPGAHKSPLSILQASTLAKWEHASDGVGEGDGAGKKDALPSLTGSMDSRGGGGVEGGYEAYLETKKTKSMSSSLRHNPLQFSNHLSRSLGGYYLPSAQRRDGEMWEPTRDFAWLHKVA